MEKQRINKFLASVGVGSRREIDRMIEAREIKVDGKVPNAGDKIDGTEVIEVKGRRIKVEVEKKVYLMLNKPKKYLSAVKDNRKRTVIDLVDVKERIYPVGRLDYDTEGLLILTNDGDLFNKVIHPKSEVYKKYIAVVDGKVTGDKLKQLSEGVNLEDGMTLPAKVKLLKVENKVSTVEIAIREGRNRQVRRMFDKLGYRVKELKRVSIGNLKLGKLELGTTRRLTKEELKYLKGL